MRTLKNLSMLACVLAMPTVLFADFSYQQTTQITGGSMLSMIKMAGALSAQARKAGEPIVSTVYLKGNRLANVSPDTIEIIDLDKEAITHIDVAKRTYTVMTFQQMKDQMAKAQQESEKRQAEHPASKPAPNPDADKVKMSFDVHVRKTGTQKQVSGLATTEAILTMLMIATDQNTKQTGNMAITNDMWVVPEIPGYAQVRDFYIRMAAKMGTIPAAGGMDLSKMLAAQNPNATQGMAEMAKEMEKIQGVPVMQVMRMGTTTDGKPLPAASEAPLPPDNSPAMPSGGEIAKQSAASVLTSHLPFGGFGKKKQEDPPPAKQDSKAPPPTSAVLLESQTSSSNFSSAPIDPSHFEVPAGFKQIQTPMDKQ